MTNTVIVVNKPRDKKSSFTAYLIWVFLGLTGAQNFYSGRKNLAIAQLLLFLVFLGCALLYVASMGLDNDWLVFAQALFCILVLLDIFDFCTLWYAIKKWNKKADEEEALVKQNASQPQTQA